MRAIGTALYVKAMALAKCFLIVSLSMACTRLSLAADSAKGGVLLLDDGITSLDLTGKGLPSMAVLAHRENFNAHGFDVLTLYVRVSAGPDEKPTWQLVPLFDDDTERLHVIVSGGPDCVLHDFRLLASPVSKALRVVLADRDTGKSFASRAPVMFSFYVLRENAEGIMGWPRYYFLRERKERARALYCDVGDALHTELGLGPYRAEGK